MDLSSAKVLSQGGDSLVWPDIAESFTERVLSLLWRHWECFGLGGHTTPAPFGCVLDPEALLCATFEFGRFSPRLFDEALRWCCHFGDAIDVSRLSALIKQDRGTRLSRVSAAFAETVVTLSGQTRWRTLARQKLEKKDEPEALFLSSTGAVLPMFGEDDAIFVSYGLQRGPFSLKPPPLQSLQSDSGGRLRLLLRRLFGTGTRSEALVLLLAGHRVTPKSASLYSGFTRRGMQQMLDELAASGMVLVMENPGESRRYTAKSYYLEKARWWSFLTAMDVRQEALPVWLSWVHIWSAFRAFWEEMLPLYQAKEVTPYKLNSCLRRGTESAMAALHVGLPEYTSPSLPSTNHPELPLSIQQYWDGVWDVLANV